MHWWSTLLWWMKCCWWCLVTLNPTQDPVSTLIVCYSGASEAPQGWSGHWAQCKRLLIVQRLWSSQETIPIMESFLPSFSVIRKNSCSNLSPWQSHLTDSDRLCALRVKGQRSIAYDQKITVGGCPCCSACDGPILLLAQYHIISNNPYKNFVFSCTDWLEYVNLTFFFPGKGGCTD